jgi:hypothetical protein
MQTYFQVFKVLFAIQNITLNDSSDSYKFPGESSYARI